MDLSFYFLALMVTISFISSFRQDRKDSVQQEIATIILTKSILPINRNIKLQNYRIRWFITARTTSIATLYLSFGINVSKAFVGSINC
jgi:hypothetical protein